MPVTGLEILDGAIKVGLGAVIAGISTYLVSKLNHDEEMEKDRLRRRREILEDIASKCDVFATHVLDYWALLADWLEVADPEKELPDHRARIKKASLKFYDGFYSLTRAEGRLLLLGQKQARLALRSYGEYAQEFYSEIYAERKDVKEEDMLRYKSGLRERYEKLLESLSEVYSRNS